MTRSEIIARNNGYIIGMATKGVLKVPKLVVATDYKSAIKFFGFHDDVIPDRNQYAYHVVAKTKYGSVAHFYSDTPITVEPIAGNCSISLETKSNGTFYVDQYNWLMLNAPDTDTVTSSLAYTNKQLYMAYDDRTTEGLLADIDQARRLVYYANHDIKYSYPYPLRDYTFTLNGITIVEEDLFKSSTI